MQLANIWTPVKIASPHDNAHPWILRPKCSQNGIVPSFWTRYGPLKLSLYSKRLCIPDAAVASWPDTDQSPVNSSIISVTAADTHFSRAPVNNRRSSQDIFKTIKGCWVQLEKPMPLQISCGFITEKKNSETLRKHLAFDAGTLRKYEGGAYLIIYK